METRTSLRKFKEGFEVAEGPVITGPPLTGSSGIILHLHSRPDQAPQLDIAEQGSKRVNRGLP